MLVEGLMLVQTWICLMMIKNWKLLHLASGLRLDVHISSAWLDWLAETCLLFV